MDFERRTTVWVGVEEAFDFFADPANLPKKGDEVDESTSVGELADVEPGATKKATFKLAPGKYAMVCALPGHYEGGMYGSLTVK